LHDETFHDASALIAAIMRELVDFPDDTLGVMDVLTGIASQDLSEENFSTPPPKRLPACSLLPQSVAAGLVVSPRVCGAIAALEDRMHWFHTEHYSDQAMGQPGYMDNYAAMEIIGDRGYFAGDDFRLGLMILGPGLTYPDHHHAAPELYWLLTGPIEYRRAPGGFQMAGTADTIWNEPNEIHAMKTGEVPMLCVWAWTKDVDQAPVLL
jgi:quercetin dioxygenase-like cupin family protein